MGRTSLSTCGADHKMVRPRMVSFRGRRMITSPLVVSVNPRNWLLAPLVTVQQTGWSNTQPNPVQRCSFFDSSSSSNAKGSWVTERHPSKWRTQTTVGTKGRQIWVLSFCWVSTCPVGTSSYSPLSIHRVNDVFPHTGIGALSDALTP